MLLLYITKHAFETLDHDDHLYVGQYYYLLIFVLFKINCVLYVIWIFITKSLKQMVLIK